MPHPNYAGPQSASKVGEGSLIIGCENEVSSTVATHMQLHAVLPRCGLPQVVIHCKMPELSRKQINPVAGTAPASVNRVFAAARDEAEGVKHWNILRRLTGGHKSG